MAKLIIRILLLLLLFLFFTNRKPQSASRYKEWPYASTNSLVSFNRITRQTGSNLVQTGISLRSKERLLGAVAYGSRSSGRHQLEPGTNTTIWLEVHGEYTFPFRGEIVQGASILLGRSADKQILIHIEQMDGGFFRTYHMFDAERDVSKEEINHTLLSKIDEAGIESLIQELRSPNLDPAVFDWMMEIPVNYDIEAQKQVWRAENMLSKLGFKAFPTLILHINDKAYCKTVEGSKLFSYTVGHVCAQIINRQVNIAGEPHRFQDRKGRKGMWDSPFIWISSENAKSWWEANKGRSLEEIQLDSVDYVIAKEKELGFINPEQEKKVLEPLEKIRSELVAKLAK
jgi:hypothetical protein